MLLTAINKNNVIIIYMGSHSYLPLAASYIHFHRDQPDLSLPSPQWWQRCPSNFHIIGADCDGNMVCALAAGRYGQVYQQALSGIAAMFNLAVRIVNVDCLVRKRCSRFSLLNLWLLSGCIFPVFAMKTAIAILRPLIVAAIPLPTAVRQ